MSSEDYQNLAAEIMDDGASERYKAAAIARAQNAARERGLPIPKNPIVRELSDILPSERAIVIEDVTLRCTIKIKAQVVIRPHGSAMIHKYADIVDPGLGVLEVHVNSDDVANNEAKADRAFERWLMMNPDVRKAMKALHPDAEIIRMGGHLAIGVPTYITIGVSEEK